MDVAITFQGDEKSFIEAAVQKQNWAQQKIYEDHYSIMFPLCCRYSNNEDDALDIMHDGFIKVFKNINKYQPGTSLNSWIRRIMVNTAIDFYRKNKRRRTEDLDTVVQVGTLEPDVISEISAAEILKALQALTPAYRSVFNLYVIEGFSHREVSEQLGISESTSRSNLVKARSKLKLILHAKGIVNAR
jgi:RNA polymerase sigma-70 factor (ECF subfamily)